MRIDGRLDRLEREACVASGGDTCSSCGRILHGPRKGHVPPGTKLKVNTSFSKDGNEERPSDFCRDCGARLVLRIRFDKQG